MKKVIAFSQEQSYYYFDYYSMEESFDESCQEAEQKQSGKCNIAHI